MKSVEQGGLGGQPGHPCTSLWALETITSAVTTLSAVTVRWIAFTVMSCVPPPVEVFCSLITSLATPGTSNVWFGAKGSTTIDWPAKVTSTASVAPRTPLQVASDSARTNEAVTAAALPGARTGPLGTPRFLQPH